MEIILSDQQQEFADDIFEKYKAKTHGLVLLDSFAGSGKTTVVKWCLDKFIQPNDYSILSPTNKACSLYQPEYETQTLHQFFRWMRGGYDDNGNLSPQFKGSLQHYPVLFIDECSMIDQELFNLILGEAHRSLVILLGDSKQLNPVKNNNTSPVFTFVDYLSKHDFSVNYRILDSDITSVISQCREQSCTTNLNFDMVPLITVRDLVPKFHEMDQNGKAVLIACSNDQVSKMNSFIRRKVYRYTDSIVLGEKLIFTGKRGCCTSTANNHVLSADCSGVEYTTGDEISIVQIHSRSVTLQNELIEFYIIRDQNDIEWYYAKDKVAFESVAKKAKMNAVRSRSSRQWAKYYEFMETYCPDLKHRYAITAYKAQGSQYDAVFVDINNIITCRSRMNPECTTREIYTAVSRARSLVMKIQY